MTYKGNGKAVHGDMLKPCSEDYKDLPLAIEVQFLTVCELWGRQSGGKPFLIPREMKPHFLRWREAAVRCKKGDFRISASEWSSVKEVAQFVFDWHCRLRGQPLKNLVWSE